MQRMNNCNFDNDAPLPAVWPKTNWKIDGQTYLWECTRARTWQSSGRLRAEPRWALESTLAPCRTRTVCPRSPVPPGANATKFPFVFTQRIRIRINGYVCFVCEISWRIFGATEGSCVLVSTPAVHCENRAVSVELRERVKMFTDTKLSQRKGASMGCVCVHMCTVGCAHLCFFYVCGCVWLCAAGTHMQLCVCRSVCVCAKETLCICKLTWAFPFSLPSLVLRTLSHGSCFHILKTTEIKNITSHRYISIDWRRCECQKVLTLYIFSNGRLLGSRRLRGS